MKRIENIDYRQNEWTVLHANLDGEIIADAFGSYEDASKFARKVRDCGMSLIGIITSRFYNAKLADE